jgi:hypothetical protein
MNNGVSDNTHIRSWQTVIENVVSVDGDEKELTYEVWEAWLNYKRSGSDQREELRSFFKSHDVVTLADIKRVRREARTWVKSFLSLSRGESYPFMKAYKMLLLYEQLLHCAMKKLESHEDSA